MESRELTLLADLREVWREDERKVSTKALLQRLGDKEESEWKHLTDRQLAKLLRPFHVRPITVRIKNETVAKGYDRGDVESAFARYLF